MIDDYNHWMLGIDVSDQQISYYHPNLRCQRNWIPMFLQTVSMTRNNIYVAHTQDVSEKERKPQRDVALEIIGVLMENAIYWDAIGKTEELRCRINSRTKKRIMMNAEKRSKKLVGVKRRRYNLPVTFFPNRLMKANGYDHKRATAEKRGTCVVCAINAKKQRMAMDNGSGDEDGSIATVKRATATHHICETCSSEDTVCYVCKKHWKEFHTAP